MPKSLRSRNDLRLTSRLRWHSHEPIVPLLDYEGLNVVSEAIRSPEKRPHGIDGSTRTYSSRASFSLFVVLHDLFAVRCRLKQEKILANRQLLQLNGQYGLFSLAHLLFCVLLFSFFPRLDMTSSVTLSSFIL